MTKFKKITDDLYLDVDKVVSVEKKVVKAGSGFAPYNFILKVGINTEANRDKICYDEYIISKCSSQDWHDGNVGIHYDRLNRAAESFI